MWKPALLVIFLAILVPKSHQQTCRMERLMTAHGSPNSKYGEFDIKNSEECKRSCLANQTCEAATFDIVESKCNWNHYLSQAPYYFSEKVCTATNATPLPTTTPLPDKCWIKSNKHFEYRESYDASKMSLEDCIKTCDESSSCKFMRFYYHNKLCHLHDGSLTNVQDVYQKLCPLTDLEYGQRCATAPSGCSMTMICHNNTCSCMDYEYYDGSSKSCKQRINYGQSCANAPSGCAKTLTCRNKICSCPDTHYHNNGSSTKCEQRINYAESCANTPSGCASTLTCLNNTCSCLDTHYFDSSSTRCEKKNQGSAAGVVVSQTSVLMLGLLVGKLLMLL